MNQIQYVLAALISRATALWTQFTNWLTGTHCDMCAHIARLDTQQITDLFAAYEHQLAGGAS